MLDKISELLKIQEAVKDCPEHYDIVNKAITDIEKGCFVSVNVDELRNKLFWFKEDDVFQNCSNQGYYNIEKVRNEIIALQKEIYEHRMTEEEKEHCEEIATILDKQGFYYKVGNPIHYIKSLPNGLPYYQAGGECYDTIIAIKDSEKINHFNYYVISVGDRGYFAVTDFTNEEFRKPYYNPYDEGGKDIPFDAFIHYLINRASRYVDEKLPHEYVMHEGYCLKAIPQDNGKYRLEMIRGYGSGMANDEVAQYGCAFFEHVFAKISCFSCKHKLFFNESGITVGEKYETKCPRCGAFLKRKKV